MSEPPTARGALAYLGLLLILPVALAIGWGIGQMPAPATVPAAAEPPAAAPPAAVARSVPAAAPAPAARHGAPVARAAAAPEPRPAAAEPEARARAERPAEVSEWTSLEDALAQSRRNGKPVLLDFSADWCPPCRMMKQLVFDHPTLGREVRTAVIPVAIVDRARETGSNPPEVEELQRRHQVDAFPTLVVFSPATGRMAKKRGFGGPEATAAWIAEASRSVR